MIDDLERPFRSMGRALVLALALVVMAACSSTPRAAPDRLGTLMRHAGCMQPQSIPTHTRGLPEASEAAQCNLRGHPIDVHLYGSQQAVGQVAGPEGHGNLCLEMARFDLATMYLVAGDRFVAQSNTLAGAQAAAAALPGRVVVVEC